MFRIIRERSKRGGEEEEDEKGIAHEGSMQETGCT